MAKLSLKDLLVCDLSNGVAKVGKCLQAFLKEIKAHTTVWRQIGRLHDDGTFSSSIQMQKTEDFYGPRYIELT